MTFWYILATAALLIFLLPYIRFVQIRIKCRREISRVCRKKGYEIITRNPIWFFGSKRGERCDVRIITRNDIYSVKLFGMKKRRSVLLIWDDGRYSVRNFIAVISVGTAIQYPIDSEARPLPRYDFRRYFKDEWELKTPHDVLLVNPVSMEFRRKASSGKETLIGDGELVNGTRVFSLRGFLSELENLYE